MMKAEWQVNVKDNRDNFVDEIKKDIESDSISDKTKKTVYMMTLTIMALLWMSFRKNKLSSQKLNVE